MKTAMARSSAWLDFLSAVQFLTRLPISFASYDSQALARAIVYFPVVGLGIGAMAALLHGLLSPHFPRMVVSFLLVVFLVLITGCFHEDGLADAADGFGGGWNREQVLMIFKDSRIGSYGAAALVLSLSGRVLLISTLSLSETAKYLIAAHVLCRWTTLPLSYFLPAARTDAANQEGLGAQVAKLTSRKAVLLGSSFSLAATMLLLHWRGLSAVATAIVITLLSGAYYKHRIGGVTGDCLGATNQLTEIAVYLVGVWSVGA